MKNIIFAIVLLFSSSLFASSGEYIPPSGVFVLPVVNVPQSITVASNLTPGVAATFTITPTSSDIRVTCNDPDGCVPTMSESGAIDGEQIKIFCQTTYAVAFSDSSGVLELAGTFSCGQYSNILMTYNSDRWIETGRTAN